jgi:hypothetical protein
VACPWKCARRVYDGARSARPAGVRETGIGRGIGREPRRVPPAPFRHVWRSSAMGERPADQNTVSGPRGWARISLRLDAPTLFFKRWHESHGA